MDTGTNVIGIKRIWTKYLLNTPDISRKLRRAKEGVPGLRIVGEGENTRILEDWIEFHAPGQAQMSTCVKTINNLARLKPLDPGSQNEGIRIGHMIWHMIKPTWEAWLEGQEAPVNGTPLNVWPGISPEQVELFKQYGMRSVEDIATMSDGIITKLPLPGIRDLKQSASLFLTASSQMQAAELLKSKEAEITEMTDQLSEMKRIVMDMQKDNEVDVRPVGKKRGRPRKTEVEAAA